MPRRRQLRHRQPAVFVGSPRGACRASTPTGWPSSPTCNAAADADGRSAAVKFMIDGTIDNGTAWLEQPDALGESTDSFWPDPADVHPRRARNWPRAGIPTATHAIGDAAVRHVLDALDGIAAHAGPGPTGSSTSRRCRPTLVGRFVRQGVVASMQPTHCTHYTRADHTDNWSTRLGPSAPTAPGAAATCATPGCRWCSAPTGRWRRSTRAACWPTPSCAGPPGEPDVPPVQPRPGVDARMALRGVHLRRRVGRGEAGRRRPDRGGRPRRPDRLRSSTR